AGVILQLRPLLAHLDGVLARHLAAVVGATLSERVREWREHAVASRQRAAELCAGDEGRLQAALQATAVHRRRTAADHGYSVPPSPAVIRGYAAHARPGLLDPVGSPKPALWAAFGAWLADRRRMAPEQGPAAFEQALREFLGALAADVFPDDLSLGALYRGANRPLDVGTWMRLASPRVTAHPEAAPLRVDTVVELPEDL